MLVPVATTTLYTVPPDRTLIVRSLTLANVGAVTETFNIRIGAGGTGTIIYTAPLASAASINLQLYLILNPTEVLRANSTLGLGLQIAGFGSLLQGAPS